MEKQEILYPGRGTDGERAMHPLLKLSFLYKGTRKKVHFLELRSSSCRKLITDIMNFLTPIFSVHRWKEGYLTLKTTILSQRIN